MLHGAGLAGIRLRIKGGARLGIDEQRADAATPELDGEHEAARPTACDQDIGFDDRPAGSYIDLMLNGDRQCLVPVAVHLSFLPPVRRVDFDRQARDAACRHLFQACDIRQPTPADSDLSRACAAAAAQSPASLRTVDLVGSAEFGG